jgi:hypothetical protein
MTEYRTKSDRIVRKPIRYHDAEEAYAVIREVYEQHLMGADPNNDINDYVCDIEFCGRGYFVPRGS